MPSKIAVLTVCIDVLPSPAGATTRAVERSVEKALENAGYKVRAVYTNHLGKPLAEDGLPTEDDFA